MILDEKVFTFCSVQVRTVYITLFQANYTHYYIYTYVSLQM